MNYSNRNIDKNIFDASKFFNGLLCIALKRCASNRKEISLFAISMNILYDTLKWMHVFALKAYFRSVSIRDEQHFREKGPVLIAVNHPSAFMDPIIIATFSKRRVAFLTAGEFFYNRFLSWFYHQLGMVPIYRPHVVRHLVDRNVSTFQACYHHLEAGGALIIFTEGSSKTEYHIRPNKTGLARMAFETAERNGFTMDIDVLPVGLVYDDPHAFGTHLLVQYGKPISAAHYYPIYQKDPREAVRRLTGDVENALKSLTWHLEEEVLAEVFELCKRSMFRSRFVSAEDSAWRFQVLNEMNRELHRWHEQCPENIQELKELALSKPSKRFSLRNLNHVLTAVVLFPFFLYGVINNWAALILPEPVLKLFNPRHDFRGSVRLLSGLIAWLLFSIFQTLLVFKWTSSFPLTLVYFFSIAAGGWFAHRYAEWFIHPVRFRSRIPESELLNFFNQRGAGLAMKIEDKLG